MKSRIILFALFIAIAPGMVRAQERKFTLEGKIESDTLEKGYVYMMGGGLKRDSCLLQNNTYHFSGVLSKPGAMVSIEWLEMPIGELLKKKGRDVLNDISATIFVEPGTIHVIHRIPFSKATVTGSKIESDMEEVKAAIKKNGDVDMAVKHYVSTHPQSWLSYMLLNDRKKSLGGTLADSLYKTLSPVLKEDEDVSKLGVLLAGAANTDIGKTAPDFTLMDTAGRQVSLSSYRGKYVLLDFWASWCAPCRRESPNVLVSYDKLKDRGFEVLSVSLDLPSSRKAWLEAIHKDGLTWTQVSDLKGFESPVVKEYGVGSIPSNFLIDPSGKIIATNLRGDWTFWDLARLVQPVTASSPKIANKARK
jgi:peroxiredoxin